MMPVSKIIITACSTLLLITLLPQNCHSFQQIITVPISKPYSSSFLCSTKSSDTDTTTGYGYDSSRFNLEQFQSQTNEESTTTTNNNNHPNNNGIEIWLDLRGTSLSPSTALELWQLEQDDCNDESSFATAPFTKCLVSPSENAHDDGEIQVLVDNTMNDTNNRQKIQSSSWGTSLPLQTAPQSNRPILPDPLPAMETISNGKYILLDTTSGWKKVEEEERLGYLLPLAELISSGANNPNGGLGFTCHTRNEVVKVAMWIQSVTNRQSDGNGGVVGQSSVRVKTLENGLVIPDYDEEEEEGGGEGDVDGELQLQFGSIRQGGLRYAIVVPYDVALLKTARDFC